MPHEPETIPEPERYPYSFTGSPIPLWLISIVYLTLLATAVLWGLLAVGAVVLGSATRVATDRSGISGPR